MKRCLLFNYLDRFNMMQIQCGITSSKRQVTATGACQAKAAEWDRVRCRGGEEGQCSQEHGSAWALCGEASLCHQCQWPSGLLCAEDIPWLLLCCSYSSWSIPAALPPLTDAAALFLLGQAAPVPCVLAPACGTAVGRTDLPGDILAGEVRFCGSGLFQQDRSWAFTKNSALTPPGLRGGLGHAARGNAVQNCRTSPVFSVLVQLSGTYGKIYVLSDEMQ